MLKFIAEERQIWAQHGIGKGIIELGSRSHSFPTWWRFRSLTELLSLSPLYRSSTALPKAVTSQTQHTVVSATTCAVLCADCRPVGVGGGLWIRRNFGATFGMCSPLGTDDDWQMFRITYGRKSFPIYGATTARPSACRADQPTLG